MAGFEFSIQDILNSLYVLINIYIYLCGITFQYKLNN